MNPCARTYRRAFVMTGDDAAGWAQAMAAEIHAALCAIGIDATLLRAAEFGDAFARPIAERYVMISINNKLKLRGVRKFAVMVDHPCTHYADLVEGEPATSTLGWVDLSHLPAAAALSSGYTSTFLPHAGPDPVADPLPASERPIDLFFSGTLTPSWDRQNWAARHPSAPAALVELIFAAVERLAETFEPVLPIFIAICAEHGVDPQRSFAPEVLCWIITKIHEIAEFNRRNAVLENLPDIAITIVSNHLPAALAGRQNVRHLGHIHDFAEIRRLMGRAKLVLNTTSKFPGGSHERIWFGMAEGAAILSDHSSYLDGQFEHLDNMLFLPQGPVEAGDLDYLADLLYDGARLDAITERAATLYRDNHTWKQRVAVIDEAVN
jgi:hypothetical protein